jgi:hypothetical protein
MKQFKLMLAMLLAVLVGQASAQSWVPAEIEDGNYYLLNVGSNKYWGVGNSWGTQASLVSSPDYVTFAKLEDGTYTMESRASNGGTAYYVEGDYMDNGNPKHLTIETNGTVFTIGDGPNLYGYAGSTVLGKNLSDKENVNAQWKIISEAEMVASLNNATVENPVDATFFIRDANFNRNSRDVGFWNIEAGNKNLSGGNNINNCAESFHSTFLLSQTISDAPNGVYALTAQGFYRQDGSNEEDLPVFYINDETKVFPVKTGSENSMSDASVAFTNGLYTISPLFVKVEDGTIVVGAKNEANTELWCIWDNFQLKYYGDVEVGDVMFSSLVNTVNELRAKAEGLQNAEGISAAANSMLADALANTADVEKTEEGLNSAILLLNNAINAANASIKAKGALDAMKAQMDATNVYTEAAYNTYKEIYETTLAKYNDGTLTIEEANALEDPSAVMGWHQTNIVDDLLLSAWGTTDYNSDLYINVWSVEGNSDGSNFVVPFFEYWTGDDLSLGSKTFTATLENVAPGKYRIGAWVRARVKNGVSSPATGITLQLNDGEPVDVAAGESVPNTQFYLGNFYAVGEVGEDGILQVKFNVLEGNNVSWLSYKNLVYAPVASDDERAALEEEIAIAKSLGVDTKTYETTPYTADEIASAIESLKEAEYAQVVADYTLNGSSLIPDLSSWEGGLVSNKGQHWNGTGTSLYYEQTGAQWGQDSWTNSSTVSVTLPAGKYVLMVAGRSSSGSDVKAYLKVNDVERIYPSKGDVGFGVATDGTGTFDKDATYANNGNGRGWEYRYVAFESDGETPVAITLGGEAAASHQWMSFTQPTLLTTADNAGVAKEELKAAIDAANATIEARTGVGEGLFLIPQTAVDAYSEVVAAQQAVYDNADATVEDIQQAIEALKEAAATYAASASQPKADAKYTFQQKQSGLYLSLYADKDEEGNVTASGVRLAEEAQPLTFEPTDGGYYLTDGELYVGLAGNNNWTMSALADKKTVITVAVLADGYYTLNQVKGSIGTDGTDVGAACYADKSVAKVGDRAEWMIAEVVEETTKEFTINVERMEKQGYAAQRGTVDFTEALAFLGIESVGEAKLSIMNATDGTLIDDYAPFDGWFNRSGDAENWGNNSSVCVKFFQALDGGEFDICDMGNRNVPAVGETFTAKWALQANGKTVVYTINVTFTEYKEVEYKPEIVKTIQIQHMELAETAYDESGAAPTFDVQEVCEALGIENIYDAKTYIVNVTTGNFVENTTDGWRNIDGDAELWETALTGFCLKLNDPGSGVFDYSGAHDTNFKVGDTYVAKWGIVYDEKAVVLEVIITFVDAETLGIRDINADDLSNANIYTVNGVKVNTANRLQKGIYIVNGKKIVVK